MKKVIFAILLATLVIALMSCGGSNVGTDTDTDIDTNTDTQTNVEKPADSDTNTEVGSNTDSNTQTTDSNKDSETNVETETEKETDTDSNVSTDTNTSKPSTPDYKAPTVEGELKNELTVFNNSTYGNEGNVQDYTTTKSVNLAVEAFNKQFMIDKGGSYRLYGTTISGGIFVQAKDQDVILVLDGVDITSKNNYPPIYSEDCKSLTIILKEGTTNVLTDTANNDGENAVIRVRSCNLTISGKGNLDINANSKYGISNTKELTINSGNIKITSPSHAINGKLGVNINGGKLNLNAGKSGIKSGDPDDKEGAVTGYVNINASYTNIVCVTNGINCYGPVMITDGKIVVKAAEGNGIDASENISVSGGILVFESYKSAISTDADVLINGEANLKLITSGNGISAQNVTISTSGVVYIQTTPVYTEITSETAADDTRYCIENDEYVKYDPLVHGINKKLYVRKDCRGIEADASLTITSGIIGVNSYEDAFNVEKFKATGGKFVLSTTGDAIDAETIEMSDSVEFNVLNAEKGLKANNIVISGGTFKITAEKDSLNADSTVINGGIFYLFEKFDLGTDGTININNGATIVLFCTNNKEQATEGTSKYISDVVANKEAAKAGKWVRIKSGTDEVLVQLTKDFTDKMAVYYASSTMGDSITIEIGTLSKNNTFVVERTEVIE